MRLEIAERQLLEMREEVVAHVVFDIPRGADEDPAHQEAEHAADEADCQKSEPILDELGSGNAAGQVIDRVSENQWRDERDALRADDADEPDQEVAPIAENVGQETAKGRHSPSIAPSAGYKIFREARPLHHLAGGWRAGNSLP